MKIHSYSVPYDISVAEAPAASYPGQFIPAAFNGRDIVLLNPFCSGNGDRVLADKISFILAKEGCRVSILSFDCIQETFCRFPARKGYQDLAVLHNPLFLVSPVSIMPPQIMNQLIKSIADQYDFPTEDIALIDEMDSNVALLQTPAHYVNSLRDIGFRQVQFYRLGFSDAAIGYLPLDNAAINDIKQRCRHELELLFDSLNLTLDRSSHYFIGYISSETPVTAMQTFVVNTLIENAQDEADMNYILVVRELDSCMGRLPAAMENVLLEPADDNFNYNTYFGRVKMMLCAPDENRLSPLITVQGSGKKRINIVFCDMLPNNLFHDFIALSRSGIMSGDQSLSEFLSLKGEVPYYDMQIWKTPLVKALIRQARRTGRPELENYMRTKYIGMIYSTNEIYFKLNQGPPELFASAQFKAANACFNHKISSMLATDYIRALARPAGAGPSSL
ncbi:hypothetical protein ACL2XP_24810 [Sodalis sp. RH21]|uniref:hypothetical protein n=1 Tax=unclassified Sodalis (in: enterobacteria) TaxID=2636512 RepID=UPI0039B628F9